MMAYAASALLLAVQGTPPATLEPLGVCSLVDGPPACWDPSGGPRPDLLNEQTAT